MSQALRRLLAELTCRVLQATLPLQLQSWGRAIRAEVNEIPDDTKALLFALHSFWGLAPRAIAFHLLQPFVALAGDDTSSSDTINMGLYDYVMRRPRSMGIACAVGSVVLGLAYMSTAGAPMRYLGVNAGALIIGLVMLAVFVRVMRETRRWPGAMTMVMAIVLLTTALLGNRVDGAARWFKFGALFIQPSLVLIPVMIVRFARWRDPLSTAGMIVSAAALAIQPDRAMAGMLAAGLTVLAIMCRDRHVILAFAASLIGAAVTLVRADMLPPVPYVDQILYSSFNVHAFAGLAVLGGSVLLVVPAIIGWLYDVDNPDAYAVFGTAWLAAILAAALGNYPTPMVGYGGSAVIGYVLSLTMFPRMARAALAPKVTLHDEIDDRPADRHLRVGLLYSGSVLGHGRGLSPLGATCLKTPSEHLSNRKARL